GARLAKNRRVAPRAAGGANAEERPPGHGPSLAWRQVRHHAGAVELDVAGTERIDAYHAHTPAKTSAHSSSISGWPCRMWIEKWLYPIFPTSRRRSRSSDLLSVNVSMRTRSAVHTSCS